MACRMGQRLLQFARGTQRRNAAAVDASVKQQEARALWLNECANRPYLEDDEKAIKAGK